MARSDQRGNGVAQGLVLSQINGTNGTPLQPVNSIAMASNVTFIVVFPLIIALPLIIKIKAQVFIIIKEAIQVFGGSNIAGVQPCQAG